MLLKARWGKWIDFFFLGGGEWMGYSGNRVEHQLSLPHRDSGELCVLKLLLHTRYLWHITIWCLFCALNSLVCFGLYHHDHPEGIASSDQQFRTGFIQSISPPLLLFILTVYRTALPCGFTCTLLEIVLFTTTFILLLLIFLSPLSLNGAFCLPVVHQLLPIMDGQEKEKTANVQLKQNECLSIWKPKRLDSDF